MLTHKIVTMSLDKLKAAPYNPRKISREALTGLQNSLKEFGLVQPIVWNKRTKHVVGGHQRILALRAAGESEASVVVVDLDEKKEKTLNVTLNNPTIEGEFTDDLANILEDIEKELPELYASLRFDSLAQEIPPLYGPIDIDDVPPTPRKPITKLGQIYSLGEHRLMCGDSLNINQVKKLIRSNAVDVVYTDPPYGINVVKTIGAKRLGPTDRTKAFGAVGGGGSKGHRYPFGGVKNIRGTVGGGHIVRANLYAPVIGDESTETAIASFKIAVGLNVATLIFWGGNYYASQLPDSRCWIVWDKDNTGNNFADGELAWTNIDAPLRIFRHMWNGLMKASERGQSRVHPTQKPVALAVWCFSEFCKKANIVLDLFGGSGSTLIACEQTGRKCLMMELSPAYCDVIVERWEKYSGKRAARL